MRTQLTEFPLCAEWTFDEEGLEGKRIGFIQEQLLHSVCGLHDTCYTGGVGGLQDNQISKHARHCLSIYVGTSRHSDTIGGTETAEGCATIFGRPL